MMIGCVLGLKMNNVTPNNNYLFVLFTIIQRTIIQRTIIQRSTGKIMKSINLGSRTC